MNATGFTLCFDLMAEVGKNVQYERNYKAVVASLDTIQAEKVEYMKEERLIDCMVDGPVEYLGDYETAEIMVDTYMTDPETFFDCWSMSDESRECLRESIDFAWTWFNGSQSIADQLRAGINTQLFVNHGEYKEFEPPKSCDLVFDKLEFSNPFSSSACD